MYSTCNAAKATPGHIHIQWHTIIYKYILYKYIHHFILKVEEKKENEKTSLAKGLN